MHKTYKTEAIILHRKTLKDADRLILCYSKDFGKLKLVAKGARKSKSKMAGSLEPFSLVNVVIAKGKSLDILISVKSIKYKNPRELSQSELRFLFIVSEILDMMAMENESDVGLYNHIKEVFYGNVGNNSSHYLLAIAHILNHFGYSPELNRCVVSEGEIEPANTYFNCRLGGAVSADHKKQEGASVKISANAVKFLRIIFGENQEIFSKVTIPQENLDEVEGILLDFAEEIMGKRFKSRDFNF